LPTVRRASSAAGGWWLGAGVSTLSPTLRREQRGWRRAAGGWRLYTLANFEESELRGGRLVTGGWLVAGSWRLYTLANFEERAARLAAGWELGAGVSTLLPTLRRASGGRLAAGGWRRAAGGGRLAAGGWRRAAGGWRLAAGGWLGAGSWRLYTLANFEGSERRAAGGWELASLHSCQL
jgi:hypothetical protein